ncbi:MAG: type II secretion system protein [Burkholderiales bacterium]|nr:type II secretion system protein [Opitutaceae bacterium]
MSFRRKGFTLTEIMIVVVLIGLLAAMAMPSFRFVRNKTYRFLINNDARQLAGAAQQYVTENREYVIVPITVDTATGVVSGPLAGYVTKITRATEVGEYDSSALGNSVAFTLRNIYVDEGVPLSFDSSGKPID